jgi:hypothetical protein
MEKMTIISLKIVEVFILSENTGRFVGCSACINSYLFSVSDKSRVKWAKSRKPTQM